MSEYLLRQYRPIADTLLRKHDFLQGDEDACVLIAKTIMFACERRRMPDRSNSPLNALRSSIKHAAAIEKNKNTSGIRKARMLARCIKLADALSNGWISFSLGVESADPTLIDNLRLGAVEAIDFPHVISLLTKLQHKWLNALKTKDSPDAVSESLRGRKRES